MNLPTGTVTFLLTDIEGSTVLWEQHPQEMRLALARQDALATDIIASHGGTLIRSQGEGDSLFAVFARASDALAATCALQKAFVTEPWPPNTPLRVRMALHTGEADLRDGDYYGSCVNRCARLRAIAHGGQILLSLATAELVRDTLPEGVRLLSLGVHRLRSLERPEQVFQLLHPELPVKFPSLCSTNVLRTNLPPPLTSFIGREKEMAAVRDLMKTTRLLTLTGSGGCGKTRLALQVAAHLQERFPDGVWLVELAARTDAARVESALAAALDVREERDRPLQETLCDVLRPQSTLLVLDNCEHLVAACARLADTLLHACPHLQLLVTSREALQIDGEAVWRVPSLSLPASRQALRPEHVARHEALRLFVERATATLQTFAVTENNVASIAHICQRLDGIPLAIELAAARVNVLTVEQIAARLDDCFPLLTGGSRTALPRQQTLQAAIDWSYALISEPERALLRRLSVFAEGWTLQAAEAVCADEALEAREILDRLWKLVGKSLVLAEERGGEQRYRLLDTVRQYGRDRLQEAGEAKAVRRRYRDWCRALAEEAESHLSGAAQSGWLDRLESEHDNLWAALEPQEGQDEREGQKEREEGEEAVLRLAGALTQFWQRRGYLREGRQCLETLLERAGNATATPGRAKALNGAGVLAWRQGDYAAAHTFYDRSLALWRELGDRRGIADTLSNLGLMATTESDYPRSRALHEESLAIRRALKDRGGIALSLNNLGLMAWYQSDYAAARAFHEQSLEVRRELGDRAGMATSFNNLGSVAWEQGDLAQARSLYAQSLALFQELGDRGRMADALVNLGLVAWKQGDLTTARSLYEQSLALFQELGEKWGIASALNNLAMVATAQGDIEKAEEMYRTALPLFRQIGEKQDLAQCLDGLAALASAQGQPERAAHLFGAAEAVREAVGVAVPRSDRDAYDRAVMAARAALQEPAFTAAWSAGRALPLEQALTYALARSERDA